MLTDIVTNGVMKFRARPIVDAFGGLTKTAMALGHKNVTTVQYWLEKDAIPDWRLHQIREAATREGVPLPDPEELREAS